MRKEIYMGHGLYKQVEVKEKAWSEKDLDLKSDEKVEWRIVELEGGGYIRRPFKIQTESQKMQDELEPIVHPTEHDESDDIEAAKRSVWGDWNKAAEKDFFKGEKWEYRNDD